MTDADGAGRAARLVAAASRALVLRADDLGDNIISSGLAPGLAAAIDGEVGVIGPPAAVGLMDTSRLAFAAGVDCRPGSYRDVLAAGRRLRAQIRRFDPDVVLLPRFDFEREAVAVALLGLRPRPVVTWAVDATPKRRRRSWWLRALPGPRLATAGAPLHELARLQHFAAFVGVEPGVVAPALTVTRDDPLTVPELAGAGRYVAFAIGAAQARRWWPLDRYAQVIASLAADGHTAVLVGAPDEVERGRQLLGCLPDGIPVVDLIGRLPLSQTAAVLAHADLLVANDSGPGHLAAAVGTPTVIVSCHPAGAPADHVNSPERYGPAGGRSVVVQPAVPSSARCAAGCVPVDQACCITGVPTEEVLAASRRQLAGLAGPVAPRQAP